MKAAPAAKPLPTPKPAPAVKPAPAPKPARSGGGGFTTTLAALSFLLAGGAIGGVGFLWWQQQQENPVVHNAIDALEAGVADVNNGLTSARQQFTQATASQKQLQEQVAKLGGERDMLQQHLDNIEQRIVRVLEGSSRVDWMLSEAAQLVNVAERRLSLLGDVNGGLALLESAEKIVAAMDEPMARPFRQALLNDIQALRGAQGEVIDTEGLLLRINSTKRLVEALEPPRPNFKIDRVETPESVAPGTSGIELAWHKIGTFMGSLVDFQRHKQPIVGIAVDPQTRFVMQQGLLLLLDQAQLSVLRGDSSTYGLALKEVADRVERYTQSDSKTGKHLLAELKLLAEQPVKQRVPEISESLLAMHAFRDAWNQQRPAREAAARRVEAAAPSDAQQPNAQQPEASTGNQTGTSALDAAQRRLP
ncbi:Putative uroporphyrin-III C-methyltransferase, initiates heme D1 synthesis [gamma proteobacterium HdN1]|nr:Putative uroporphyrin-III C-methyltransferase, initiates heme D1 synthesis [gamma proteobacterium HdN1]